jgi:hypothetical protein
MCINFPPFEVLYNIIQDKLYNTEKQNCYHEQQSLVYMIM